MDLICLFNCFDSRAIDVSFIEETIDLHSKKYKPCNIVEFSPIKKNSNSNNVIMVIFFCNSCLILIIHN